MAFASDATNLVSGDTNRASDVFVHDRHTSRTQIVSRHSLGPYGNRDSSRPSISGDGRLVAFESDATNLVSGDANGARDVFVQDRLASTVGRTVLVSRHSSGPYGNAGSGWPSISRDGRFVAFDSSADNLVDDDGNGIVDVFVHDRLAGTIGDTTLESRNTLGLQGDSGSSFAAVSADGSQVTFSSSSTNLAPDDDNGSLADIFVRDRSGLGATTTLVSRRSLIVVPPPELEQEPDCL